MQRTDRGMNRREFLKMAGVGSIALASVPALGYAQSTPASAAESDLVRWDIIHVLPVPPANGSVFTAGGEASAFAYFTPGTPSTAKITLTGFGTFVAPASGGTSSEVSGGGTWETSGEGLPAARGTYKVTRVVSWAFANLQAAAPAFVDNIANSADRANGTAVFLVEYSDGAQGTLGVGCHGPGAPNGILEGIIATKGYITYWNGELPVGNADKNRTLFHIAARGPATIPVTAASPASVRPPNTGDAGLASR